MTKQKRKIVLASKSPRRKEILENAGYEIEIRVSSADETLPKGISPEEAVCYLAEKKAETVKRGKDEVVIGADTVVVLDGEILGKPNNTEQAVSMLKALSGKEHTVYTGVCGVSEQGKTVFYETTKVTFSQMTDKEILEYVNTGDCCDKAGAYGIQGYASRFIKCISGDYFNVVGLPIHKTYENILKNI